MKNAGGCDAGRPGYRRVVPAVLAMTLVLAVLGGQAPVQASIPVTACGTILGAAGDYHVTGNLGPCSGHGVEIRADNGGLDLQGFTISGISSPGPSTCNLETPQHGILVTTQAPGVRITNGTVPHFADGIVAWNSRVTSSGVDGVALVTATFSTVTANVIANSHRYGVLLASASNGNTISENEFTGNGVREGGAILAVFGDRSQLFGRRGTALPPTIESQLRTTLERVLTNPRNVSGASRSFGSRADG